MSVADNNNGEVGYYTEHLFYCQMGLRLLRARVIKYKKNLFWGA